MGLLKRIEGVSVATRRHRFHRRWRGAPARTHHRCHSQTGSSPANQRLRSERLSDLKSRVQARVIAIWIQRAI